MQINDMHAAPAAPRQRKRVVGGTAELDGSATVSNHNNRSDWRARFTIISNVVLYDKRLNLDSRGLLSAILSKPPNWVSTVASLMREHDIGKHRAYRMFGEMREAGYVYTVKARDPDTGGYRPLEHRFFDMPAACVKSMLESGLPRVVAEGKELARRLGLDIKRLDAIIEAALDGADVGRGNPDAIPRKMHGSKRKALVEKGILPPLPDCIRADQEEPGLPLGLPDLAPDELPPLPDYREPGNPAPENPPPSKERQSKKLKGQTAASPAASASAAPGSVEQVTPEVDAETVKADLIAKAKLAAAAEVRLPKAVLDGIRNRLLEVAGDVLEDQARRTARSMTLPKRWLALGWDFEADILPSIEEQAASLRRRRRKVRHWGYFEPGIETAYKTRVSKAAETAEAMRKGGFEVEVTNGAGGKFKSKATQAQIDAMLPDGWDVMMTGAYKPAFGDPRGWSGKWGPAPGEPGCFVPPYLQRLHGFTPHETSVAYWMAKGNPPMRCTSLERWQADLAAGRVVHEEGGTYACS